MTTTPIQQALEALKMCQNFFSNCSQKYEPEKVEKAIAALSQVAGEPVEPVAQESSELMQLRAQNMALLNVYDAVANLVKVKGRYHSEKAYERLVTAYEALRDDEPQPADQQEKREQKKSKLIWDQLSGFYAKDGD